jgi:hypothetical protein
MANSTTKYSDRIPLAKGDAMNAHPKLAATPMLLAAIVVISFVSGCVDVRCLPRRIHFLPDHLTWWQEKKVPVQVTDIQGFQQCVSTAVTKVSGVSINQRSIQPPSWSIGLNADLSKPSPPVGLLVQHRIDNTDVIAFVSAVCPLPSKQQEKEMASVLDSIGDAISKECGRNN